MAIHIANPVTDAVVRLLARRTGRSLTEAIDEAVREKLDRLDCDHTSGDRLDAAVERLQRWGSTMGDPDELYDEAGLPR